MLFVPILLLLILGCLAITFLLSKKNTNNSFLYGFSISLLAYLGSSFIFFWFSVLRRMAVLNISLKFDSDVVFGMIIVPIIVAIPWLPSGIIIGLISHKKGNKIGLRYFYTLLLIITIILSMLFWNLRYNWQYNKVIIWSSLFKCFFKCLKACNAKCKLFIFYY